MGEDDDSNQTGLPSYTARWIQHSTIEGVKRVERVGGLVGGLLCVRGRLLGAGPRRTEQSSVGWRSRLLSCERDTEPKLDLLLLCRWRRGERDQSSSPASANNSLIPPTNNGRMLHVVVVKRKTGLHLPSCSGLDTYCTSTVALYHYCARSPVVRTATNVTLADHCMSHVSSARGGSTGLMPCRIDQVLLLQYCIKVS